MAIKCQKSLYPDRFNFHPDAIRKWFHPDTLTVRVIPWQLATMNKQYSTIRPSQRSSCHIKVTLTLILRYPLRSCLWQQRKNAMRMRVSPRSFWSQHAVYYLVLFMLFGNWDVYRGQVSMALLNYLCRGKRGKSNRAKNWGQNTLFFIKIQWGWKLFYYFMAFLFRFLF